MTNATDITGLKFNRLTAVKIIRKNPNYKHVWLFFCECGGSKESEAWRVTSGHTKSCGCIRSKDKNLIAIENQAYGNHRLTAIHKGLEWNLTKDEYLKIARKPCVYCGEITIRKSRSSDATMPLNSVDRKENLPFYTFETCQPLCFKHQKMKSSMGHEEFTKECQLIADFLRRNE